MTTMESNAMAMAALLVPFLGTVSSLMGYSIEVQKYFFKMNFCHVCFENLSVHSKITTTRRNVVYSLLGQRTTIRNEKDLHFHTPTHVVAILPTPVAYRAISECHR